MQFICCKSTRSGILMEFQRNTPGRNMVIAVWFLIQNVFYFCICFILLFYFMYLFTNSVIPWLLQRGLLLVVNWELVTVLVYRVVSRGLTCVETGFKDWPDFCKVVSPCFLSCVPVNLILLRNWQFNYRITDGLNNWPFTRLFNGLTDRHLVWLTN